MAMGHKENQMNLYNELTVLLLYEWAFRYYGHEPRKLNFHEKHSMYSMTRVMRTGGNNNPINTLTLLQCFSDNVAWRLYSSISNVVPTCFLGCLKVV